MSFPLRQQRGMLGLILSLMSVAGGAMDACTIPVFRYALDRWEPDAFRLVIPAAWATRPDMLKLLVPLRGNGEANLRIVETTDTNTTEARLVFPHSNTQLWSGMPDAATLPPLLDSPARQDLIQRILAGDSVVWVVCTGADTGQAEANRIEKRLRYLEQVAALPPQDPNDPDSQLGPGPPLALRFSVLRLSLADPAEKLFAAMLAGPKQQDFLAKGISFAAPVFAKGRVLGAWPLEDLDDPAIEDASLFLIGRCSCRLKNDNPGWDVVLRIDWEQSLARIGESRTARLDPKSGDAPAPPDPSADEVANPPAQPITVPVTAAPPASMTGQAAAANPLPWPTIGGVAIALLCAIAGIILWRGGPANPRR